jgi:hypothetical protein
MILRQLLKTRLDQSKGRWDRHAWSAWFSAVPLLRQVPKLFPYGTRYGRGLR